MTLDILYYLTVAFFFTHELDAVKRRECRILPGLRLLPEKLGAQLFIWLHVPIFALLLIGSDGADVNATRLFLSSFAVLHVALHWSFRNHPDNEFHNISSWTLILATGATGASYLLVVVA